MLLLPGNDLRRCCRLACLPVLFLYKEVFASLPLTIREAIEHGDEAAFQRAMEALSPEEQQSVLAAIQYLQEQAEEESEETEEK